MDSAFSKSNTEHKNAPIADNPMTSGEPSKEFLEGAGRDNSAFALNWGNTDSGFKAGIGEAAGNDSW